MIAPRSYLYVPGDQPRMMVKSAELSTDAVILDLEDAVGAEAKDVARDHVLEFLAGRPAGPELWVRIEPSRVSIDMESLLACSALRGLVVPKADEALLGDLDRAMTAAEQREGRDAGSFGLIPLIETAQGVLGCATLAGMPRVVRLGVGEADLAADLGITPSLERLEMWPIRLQLVVASVAAGILPPIGPVHLDVADDVGLDRSTRGLLSQGFRARTALHPRQLDVINGAFSPSADDVSRAREVVALFEASTATGSAVLTDASGSFVDAAVVRQARSVLERADAVPSTQGEPPRRWS